MTILPQTEQLILHMRQRYPQFAHLSDGVLIRMVVEIMQTASDEDLASMPAQLLDDWGEQLLIMGHWDSAEKFFLNAVEHAERENILIGNEKGASLLG